MGPTNSLATSTSGPAPLLGAAHCPRYRRRADDSSLFLTTLPSPPLPEAQRHYADRLANAPRRRRQDPSGGEDRTSELLPMPGCTIFGIFMPRPCYWLGPYTPVLTALTCPGGCPVSSRKIPLPTPANDRRGDLASDLACCSSCTCVPLRVVPVVVAVAQRRLVLSSSATTSTVERALSSSAVQLRCWSRSTTTCGLRCAG